MLVQSQNRYDKNIDQWAASEMLRGQMCVISFLDYILTGWILNEWLLLLSIVGTIFPSL